MTEQHQDVQAELNDQLLVRREKMAQMAEAGVNPFAAGFIRDHLSAQILHDYSEIDKEALEEKKIPVRVAGRMVSKRGKGKAGFAHLLDMDGKIQIYVRQDSVGEDSYQWFKAADLGDIVGVVGYVFKTNTGELSVFAQEFHPLTKALRPLPDKYHGLTNVEQRYRQRYLDLISNEESRERFILRSKIVREIRRF